MLKEYTPIEYVCIDVANTFGLDKLLFEDRIQWVKDHVNELEALADEAEDKVLYMKAVHALRECQAGKPIGHLVPLDAICSGVSLLSVMAGCVKGADATGLVTEKRADAYTEVTAAMNKILIAKGMSSIDVPRADVKRAVMTSAYGSTLVPKEVFGEGDMLATFYQAAFQVAPAAFELMSVLLSAWQPNVLAHSWVMPDNFHVNIKVMQSKEARIQINELGDATFTTYVKINEGTEKGVSLVANVTHSLDSYVLRSLVRRASFVPSKVEAASDAITIELLSRTEEKACPESEEDLLNMLTIYEYSKMLDVSIIDYITHENIQYVPATLLKKLNKTLNKMLELGSKPVLTIHDA